MEPENQPTNQNPQPMEKPVKKCKHTTTIIILAILAIGGLGFGGFELWQNIQKDNEINTLKEQNRNGELDKIAITNEDAEKFINDAYLNSINNKFILFAHDNTENLITYDFDYFSMTKNKMALADIGVRDDYAKDTADIDCQSGSYATFKEFNNIYKKIFGYELAESDIEGYSDHRGSRFAKSPCNCSCRIPEGENEYSYYTWNNNYGMMDYLGFSVTDTDEKYIYGTLTNYSACDHSGNCVDDPYLDYATYFGSPAGTFELGYRTNRDGSYYITSLVFKK